MVKRRTGIEKFDELTVGIDPGSRTILYGSPGTVKSVFAMQFLWEGLKNGEAADLDLNVASNIILFRLNEETWRREIRIVKMEGTGHPLNWLPFKITNEGIELL